MEGLFYSFFQRNKSIVRKFTLPHKNINLHYSGYSIRNTYVLNKFLTADRSCKTKYFWKNFYINLYSTSLRFFWQLLRQNWSIIRGTVSLWSMFENRQLAVFEGKCRRFRNSSECLKTHCTSNNLPIGTKKVPKQA